ncbi:MAG: hypothetical protein FJ386_14355 [Verrucomicrobia bacterium]|nr:hypothetical protein [Verrucomicrobiota bacterium]
MSKITREEVLVRMRERYARAGKTHKSKIITEARALESAGGEMGVDPTRPRQPLGSRALT